MRRRIQNNLMMLRPQIHQLHPHLADASREEVVAVATQVPQLIFQRRLRTLKSLSRINLTSLTFYTRSTSLTQHRTVSVTRCTTKPTSLWTSTCPSHATTWSIQTGTTCTSRSPKAFSSWSAKRRRQAKRRWKKP
jgi:hypothetical protein